MSVPFQKRIKRNLTLAAISFLLVQFTVWVPGFAATTPIDFAGFTGSGFAPNPSAGQLDSDIWRVTGLSDGNGTFGGTHTAGDFARGSSNGGVTTGGIYAFTNVGTSGNNILGVQPSDADFTPGDFTLRVQNTTGNEITQLYISYKIWVLNNAGRSSSLNFSYSTDDTNYTDVSSLNFTTPEAADGSPAWTSTDRSTTISGLSLANNAYFYLRWVSDDVGGSGSRDEFGLDDIEVRINGPTAITLRSLSASAQPTTWPLTALATVAALGIGAVTVRRRKG